MRKRRPKRLNSEQVIKDLISLLNENQLIEYVNLIGAEQYHVTTTPSFRKLEYYFESEAQSSDPSKVHRMREELIDFIFEEGIPPLGGIRFQEQVARWLKRKGDDVNVGESVRGVLTHQRYHDVDIHIKKKVFLAVNMFGLR